MSRKLAQFSADDVARAFKGAQSGGARIARCEIQPDGRIVLVTTEGAALDGEAKTKANPKLTPLQRWQAEDDAG